MPANGRVIPHTPLAVDFWAVRRCPHVRLFFLSHLHGDHTAGLTSTWTGRPIYCSPVTATLLALQLQVKRQWIHPLELDEPHLLPLDEIGAEWLTVTLLDANHCPGSVMFLFQGYFGSILYTGDFRFSPTMLREPCLRNNIVIDVLYIDNTNCDPTRVLPSRQSATQNIKEIIRRHPDHDVIIGLYSLGKESLLIDLAMEFKSWVEVTAERMRTLRALELTDVFTTDAGVCRLRAVDHTEIRYANMQQWNRVAPTLAILPTSRHLLSFHPNIHVVPYSDHSSYRELEDFVSALRPTFLIPIVGTSLPGSLLALTSRRKRCNVLVPESVQNYMLKPSWVQSTQQKHKCPPPRCPGPRPPPRGVVFESPLRSSANSSGFVRDTNTPSRWAPEEVDVEEVVMEVDVDVEKVAMEDEDTGHTATDNMDMSESFPVSQLYTQSNFAQMKIMTNTIPSLIPVAVRRVTSEPNSGTVSNRETRCVCSGPLTEEHEVLCKLSCGEMESILHLPFTQEDMRSYVVLDQSFIKLFRLVPVALKQGKQSSGFPEQKFRKN